MLTGKTQACAGDTGDPKCSERPDHAYQTRPKIPETGNPKMQMPEKENESGDMGTIPKWGTKHDKWH